MNEAELIVESSKRDLDQVHVPPINLINVDSVCYLFATFPFLFGGGSKSSEKKLQKDVDTNVGLRYNTHIF